MFKPLSFWTARGGGMARFPQRVVRASMAIAALAATAATWAGSATYTYDALGRLRTVTYSNGVVITYSYDAAGNRSSVVTSGA